MKHLASIALLLPFAGCTLPAQDPVPPPIVSSPVIAPRVMFTQDQLDVLLGSIALYPDALIAIMLPASTSASDIVLASRYLQSGGNPDQVDAQPWDDSVRALAHYPQVVRWMDDNLAWTNQLGDAFAAQPADVMASIQRLRARARAAGTLVDTPQQQVVYEGGTILIVPAQPDVIYVPYYDPAVVYVPRDYYSSYSPGSYFGFSTGFAAGWWLSYGLDWGHRRVWVVDRHERERYWREHQRDWHRPPVQSYRASPQIRPWQPRTDVRIGSHYSSGRPSSVVRPIPQDRERDYRDYRRDDSRGERHDQRRDSQQPSSNHPPFVGPSAPMMGPAPAVSQPAPAVSQPAPTPPRAPAIREVPSPSNGQSRYDRGDRQGQRGDRPSRYTPAQPPAQPAAQAPIMGPTVAAPVYQGRGRAAPSASSSGPAAAPQPQPAPPIHRHNSPPAPAPQQAPPMQVQPAPQPAAQSQSQPPPSSNNNSDEEKRRPPFIRPR